jgi:3-oxoadipate enol-lactonase
MASIDIGRHRISFDLHGPPERPVIAFVNGLTQSTGLWAPYAEYFAPRGYRVLAYDTLGQGRSSKPVLGVSLDRHVEVLGRLLDTLGIGEVHLAGISFGGVIALRFAIASPRRVRTLVAMSTFSELTPQLELLGRAWHEALLEAGLPLLQSLLLPMNFSSAWLAANAAALPELKRRGYVSNDLYAIQNLVEAFVDFRPFTAELGRITCPTLVLNGEWDPLTPRVCHETLRRGLPNARLVIVPHAFHAFTLEFPGLVARLIEHFVRAVEDGSWKGDGSVWIAADRPEDEPLLRPCRGDHTRAVPVGAGAAGADGA